jgi:excisionase family DNA binding protein
MVEPLLVPHGGLMPPTTRSIETSLDHRNESDANANTFPSSEQKSLPALVVCFLLPAEQLEDLVSTLKGIAANPQSTATPLCSSYETTASTSHAAWFTHLEAARYLGISTSTLYRYAEQERIECRKTGNHLEYRRPALDHFKENQIRPARHSRARGIIPSTLNSGK